MGPGSLQGVLVTPTRGCLGALLVPSVGVSSKKVGIASLIYAREGPNPLCAGHGRDLKDTSGC